MTWTSKRGVASAAPITAREMMPAVGALIQVRCEDLWVECRVADVKNVYGKTRFLVRPVAGIGEQWVELHRVRVPKATQAVAHA